MIEDVERSLRLQEVDARILELTKEIAELPKHIAVIEKQLDGHRRKLEADRAALAANQKERKQRDIDIETHKAKVSKLRDQMNLAKTNEQYRAFQHEIEYAEAEIRKAEDRILDLMAEGEPLEANVKAAEKALEEEKKSVEAEKASARERTAVDQKALAEAKSQRAALAAELSPAAAVLYERIKKKHPAGPVVADATHGRCTACNMMLRPQYFQDLKTAAKLMQCESCGRMLRYAPPIDVVGQMDGGTRVSLS